MTDIKTGPDFAFPMEDAPKDGSILRLLVKFDRKSAAGPFEDTTEPSWTIGTNNKANTGEDQWDIVGWSWEQDVFCHAYGAKAIGWLPFHTESNEPTGVPSPAPAESGAVAAVLGSEDDLHSVAHALDIGSIGAPYRAYQGSVYCDYQSYRIADFQDYGLALAATVLFNNAKAIKSALASPAPSASMMVRVTELEFMDQADDEAIKWIGANATALRTDGGSLLYGMATVVRAFQAGRAAALDSPPDHGGGEGLELLATMATHLGWELDWGPRDPNDEEGEFGWRVHDRRGNRSDLEWTLIGFGASPADALRAALRSQP